MIKLFTHPHHDGEPVKWDWVIFCCRFGKQYLALHWHRHTPACQYGFYQNLRAPGGLILALNIPLLGDFSLVK